MGLFPDAEVLPFVQAPPVGIFNIPSNARKDAVFRKVSWNQRTNALIKRTSGMGKTRVYPVTLVIWIAHNIVGTIAHAPLKSFICEVTPKMIKENSHPVSFPLRLPFSTRRQAIEIAQREGLSLNQFISLAVAEKITRLEHVAWPEQMNSQVHILGKRKEG